MPGSPAFSLFRLRPACSPHDPPLGPHALVSSFPTPKHDALVVKLHRSDTAMAGQIAERKAGTRYIAITDSSPSPSPNPFTAPLRTSLLLGS